MVIRKVILHGAESLALQKLKNLMKIESRIYGPRPWKAKEGYRLRSNLDIYEKQDNLESALGKKRLNFYDYMVRMGQKR